MPQPATDSLRHLLLHSVPPPLPSDAPTPQKLLQDLSLSIDRASAQSRWQHSQVEVLKRRLAESEARERRLKEEVERLERENDELKVERAEKWKGEVDLRDRGLWEGFVIEREAARGRVRKEEEKMG